MVKQVLAFDIDQGWPDGVAMHPSIVANIAHALSPLNVKYDVCAIITPTFPDRTLSEGLMDACKSVGLPFILKVITSDAMTLGITSWHAPYDIQRGVAIPQKRLWVYKARYGDYFKALAFHEVFALDWLLRTNSPWLKNFQEYVTYPTSFDVQTLEAFIAWAKENKMGLWWSDPYYALGQPEDRIQPDREAVMRTLQRKYPNTVVVGYANNLNGMNPPPPGFSGTDRRGSYWKIILPNLIPQTRGWFLSNQAWMTTDPMACPIGLMIDWFKGALGGGAYGVFTEPGWYWLDLNSGLARSNLTALIQAIA